MITVSFSTHWIRWVLQILITLQAPPRNRRGGSGDEEGEKMATHCYTVLVEKENGGYRAHCPALPGCRSFGDTKKEAVNNIRFSISYRLESLMAKGKPIPKDGDLARPVQKSA
jgi:antitoxin HicB